MKRYTRNHYDNEFISAILAANGKVAVVRSRISTHRALVEMATRLKRLIKEGRLKYDRLTETYSVPDHEKYGAVKAEVTTNISHRSLSPKTEKRAGDLTIHEPCGRRRAISPIQYELADVFREWVWSFGSVREAGEAMGIDYTTLYRCMDCKIRFPLRAVERWTKNLYDADKTAIRHLFSVANTNPDGLEAYSDGTASYVKRLIVRLTKSVRSAITERRRAA